MSYGSPSRCIAEERQIQRAVKAGAVPVAASGNEFAEGNPLEFPASLAARADGRARSAPTTSRPASRTRAPRSTSRAPGIGILTAVPAAFDPDGNGDGFAGVSGTSFSAPMVSAAVAWVRAARPDLTPFQAGAGRAPRRARRRRARLRERDRLRRAEPPGRARAASRPPTTRSSPTTTSATSTGARSATLAPPLFNGRPASIAATADVAEDPIDVYRVKVRAGAQACGSSLEPERRRPRPVRVRRQGPQRALGAAAGDLVARAASGPTG